MKKLAGYYYINLAKRRDRDLFMRWSLRAMGFEEYEINRFEAVNGSSGVWKDHASIAEVASKEFPFFESLIASPIQDIHGPVDNNPRNVAIQWTWCRLLNMLSKTLRPGEYALCGTDEVSLQLVKGNFEWIINNVDDLDILQVCWGHVDHDKIDELRSVAYSNIRLVHKLGGIGDQLIMLNREGARQWLHWITHRPTLFVEIQPAKVHPSQLERFYGTPDTHGFYHAVPTDFGGSDRIGFHP